MTHSEAAIAALFDHEQEQEQTGASLRGRERPAPDWGGDDLFSSTPRRRRRLDPEQARRAAAERHRVRDNGEHHLYALPVHEEWRGRGSEHPTAELAPAPAAATGTLIERELEPRPRFDAAEVTFAEIAPPKGRRTVTVTGHPEPRIERTRRPAPTVDQRIGHRPDRIAGWAFALGMLLILIAIITAHAG